MFLVSCEHAFVPRNSRISQSDRVRVDNRVSRVSSHLRTLEAAFVSIFLSLRPENLFHVDSSYHHHKDPEPYDNKDAGCNATNYLYDE